MSDNDLIRRGVIKERMIARGWKHPDSTVTEFVEDDLPAVPREMTAREYIIIEERCKSWCLNNCSSNGGCESCRYRGFCWVDAIEPEEYLRFYALWAKEHPERSEEDES